jgi:hypothetical protein
MLAIAAVIAVVASRITSSPSRGPSCPEQTCLALHGTWVAQIPGFSGPYTKSNRCQVPLALIVRLGSERTVAAVRDGFSFAKKDRRPAFLLVVAVGASPHPGSSRSGE